MQKIFFLGLYILTTQLPLHSGKFLEWEKESPNLKNKNTSILDFNSLNNNKTISNLFSNLNSSSLAKRVEKIREFENQSFLELSKRKRKRSKKIKKKKPKTITIETEDGKSIEVTEEEAEALAMAQQESNSTIDDSIPLALNISAKNFTLPSNYEAVKKIKKLSPQTMQDLQDLEDDPFPKGVEMIEGKAFQTPIFMDDVMDSVQVKTSITMGNKNLKGNEDYMEAHGMVETPFMYKSYDIPKMPPMMENGLLADDHMTLEGPSKRAARKMYGQMSEAMKARIKSANEKMKKELEKDKFYKYIGKEEAEKRKKLKSQNEEEIISEEDLDVSEKEIEEETEGNDTIADGNDKTTSSSLRFKSKADTSWQSNPSNNTESDPFSLFEKPDDSAKGFEDLKIEKSTPKELDIIRDAEIIKRTSIELNQFLFEDLFNIAIGKA